MSDEEAKNKRAIERLIGIIDYAASEYPDMEIHVVAVRLDGDSKAGETIPPIVAGWIKDWCQDMLDQWGQP